MKQQSTPGWNQKVREEGGGDAVCSVQRAVCRVQGAGCRMQGAGCRVQGAGCRVQGDLRDEAAVDAGVEPEGVPLREVCHLCTSTRK